MIRFFQTGIIFIYFVLEEEVTSFIENDHISINNYIWKLICFVIYQIYIDLDLDLI